MSTVGQSGFSPLSSLFLRHVVSLVKSFPVLMVCALFVVWFFVRPTASSLTFRLLLHLTRYFGGLRCCRAWGNILIAMAIDADGR